MHFLCLDLIRVYIVLSGVDTSEAFARHVGGENAAMPYRSGAAELSPNWVPSSILCSPSRSLHTGCEMNSAVILLKSAHVTSVPPTVHCSLHTGCDFVIFTTVCTQCKQC